MSPAIHDAAVEAAFDAFAPDARAPLLRLRALVFDTAEGTEGCGSVRETLKWGEPAYLTERPKSGTTIRLGVPKGSTGRYAMFVPCQTTLVQSFRQHYGELFAYEGNRAVIFDADRQYPQEAVRHLMALALTYHLTRR